MLEPLTGEAPPGEEEPRWRAWALYRLAAAYVDVIDDEAAAGCLARAREIAAGIPELALLEARIVRRQARAALRARRFEQAEELTLEAGRLFDDAGEPVWAAAAQAELAGLYSLLGREDDVY